MNNLKRIAVVALLVTLAGLGLSAQAQRRRAPVRSTANVLTGTYRLNTSRGDDARQAAERATRNLPERNRQRVLDNLVARLESPEAIAIQQTGRTISMASSSAPQITFEADGQERSEANGNGRTLSTRATLTGNRLEVNSTGDRNSDFKVTFESLSNGQQLGVTRTIYSERLDQPLVVRSFYDKNDRTAQWNVYNGDTYGDTPVYSGNNNNQSDPSTFVIPDGTRFVGVLNNDLSTNGSRDREPFTVTVREPSQYAGATIDGYVTGVTKSGRITGRSQMTLNFETIRLRNGRSYRFTGLVEGVRADGKDIRVDNEGNAQSSNQTEKTGVRAAIGTGVGAIIGAIVGGGKGAAIGAVVGAGTGAGSVYVQGEENLELKNGTELTIRASAPSNTR